MTLLRFAPSPTGALHLGGLRTALYNFLYARKVGGKWILRLEDTDTERTVPGGVDNIRSALEWAGVHYDHGPGVGGPHGPYFQSERLDLYHNYADKLLKSGHAYRCFCTQERLAETRERLARTGSNRTYDKACLNLTEEEVARRVRAGEKSVVRLNDGRLPDRPFPKDIVFGSLRDSHASLPTDPILLKSDQFPTYHLASVVDDHEMGITHVLRGEEWLPSLPLHLDLYATLGLKPPEFGHLPLLLNLDGSKMSKRKGDVQVLDYMRRGWEPGAVLNWLALAGWGTNHEVLNGESLRKSSPDSTEVMNLTEMVQGFDLSVLTHRRSILDPMKLEYLNKHHLMREIATGSSGQARLAERIHQKVKTAFPASQYTSVEHIAQVIEILQGRLTNLQDVPLLAPYFFVEPNYATEEAQKMLKSLGDASYVTALDNLIARLEEENGEWSDLDLSAILHAQIQPITKSTKVYMTIIRHALTGMKAGPAAADIMRVLGRERSQQRLLSARRAYQGKSKL
ncbi:Glutamate--tRNA ligase mitochondrial [Steccherinum ochraceum]|uniref:Glutamate--tRNA ligase, mitochondrial n=1 Tax=Steccherinum ochraceum TaxID=92696 RepID=A0A4V6N785_9APHY|nr:Glutamate--tRNA ligase mitochondrial [Steccherinum ochraceum]